MEVSKDIETLLDTLESGHIILDGDYKVTFWNRWLCINTQIDKRDILGKDLFEIFPSIDAAILKRKIATSFLLSTPTFYDSNRKEPLIPIKRNKVTSGSLEMMQQQVTISPCNMEQKAVMINIYDISEVHEAKILLARQMKKVKALNTLLESQQDLIDKNIIMTRVSLDGTMVDVSSKLCNFFGYEKEELLGEKISLLGSSKIPEGIFSELWSRVLGGESWSGELANLTKKHELKWVLLKIDPVFDGDGKLKEFSAFYSDITNKKLLEELYIRDPLTKIYNRAHFDKHFNSLFGDQRKTSTPSALVIIDIDHFKKINDTYGHQTGDEALIVVASILEHSIRSEDMVARWGGEEFVMLLKNVSKDEAIEIAQKLRSKIKEANFASSLTLTCSFGLTLFGSSDDPIESFKRADDALYEAKNGGRDRVVFK